MTDNDNLSKKHILILEAARRRFALYGIDKTTMQEIANDLRMAKGSIYYYYEDKENLYKAVIESEHSEFLRGIQNELAKIKNPIDGLEIFVIKRLSYFKKLINLSRMNAQTISEFRPLITGIMIELREKEKLIVQSILESGNESGVFNVEDPYETADLFLDLLRGLRSVLLKDKTLLYIDEEEYSKLTGKALDFTRIFINGLKIKKKQIKLHKR